MARDLKNRVYVFVSVSLCFPQIRPYVNGALYSILCVPSVRQEAKEMVRQQKCLHLLWGNRRSLCIARHLFPFTSSHRRCLKGNQQVLTGIRHSNCTQILMSQWVVYICQCFRLTQKWNVIILHAMTFGAAGECGWGMLQTSLIIMLLRTIQHSYNTLLACPEMSTFACS